MRINSALGSIIFGSFAFFAADHQVSAQTYQDLEELRQRAAVEIKRLENAISDIEIALEEDEQAVNERLRSEPSALEVAEDFEDTRRQINLLTLGKDPNQAIDEAQKLVWEAFIKNDTDVGVCGPLKRQDIPELERRILTLPGARLHEFPGVGASPERLPTFSVLHVFGERTTDDGASWLNVGASADCRNIDGWIAAANSEDWRSMLVMQFAPRGSRERVLFFKNNDDLAGLVESGFAAEEADDAYDQIANGNADSDIYVAIEPKTAASFAERQFLMPILNWRYTSFLDGDPVTLLQIAGLNSDPDASPSEAIDGSEGGDLGKVQPALRRFKIGVKFVVDTTVSMRPYLERTQDIVEQIYGRLATADLLQKAAFGLVAYRDNLEPNARIEYVTRVIQRLDQTANPAAILSNIRRAEPSPVPTKDWNEDAYAGLAAAIDDRDWQDFDLRLVILVSDAGARERFDPLASLIGLGAEEVRERARSRNIAIIPVHLLTNEARKAGNIEPAKRQYELLNSTGDINAAKYIGIEAGDPEAFRADVAEFADELVDAISTLARGRLVRPEPIEPDPVNPRPRLKDVFANELFRAQLEFLGTARDGQQRFYRAWASDRDLTDPGKITLEVRAFFTRNQLNSLAQRLDAIIKAADRNNSSPQEFFESLASLSATMAVEGDRESADEFEVGSLLPAFLRALPYKSRILKMRLDDWISLGPTGRDELINELRSKQLSYKDLNASETEWVDFNQSKNPSSDRSRMVTPMSLSLLP